MTSFSQVFRPQAKRPKPDNQFRPIAPHFTPLQPQRLQSNPSLFLVKNQNALNDRIDKIFRRLRKLPDKFTFHIIKAFSIIHVQRHGLFDGIQRKAKQAFAFFFEFQNQCRDYHRVDQRLGSPRYLSSNSLVNKTKTGRSFNLIKPERAFLLLTPYNQISDGAQIPCAFHVSLHQ